MLTRIILTTDISDNTDDTMFFYHESYEFHELKTDVSNAAT